jgi:hypothetical protein
LNFASQQIENPLMESEEEQELAVGIDEELNEVRRPHEMEDGRHKQSSAQMLENVRNFSFCCREPAE